MVISAHAPARMFLLGGIVHLQENVDMSLNGDLRKAGAIMNNQRAGVFIEKD